MQYRPTWDLGTIPDDVFARKSAAAGRLAATENIGRRAEMVAARKPQKPKPIAVTAA